MLPKKYLVTRHTDHIGPGSTFVAIPGFQNDGTKYIKKAINLGATKIIVEKTHNLDSIKNDIENDIEYVFVENARKSLAQLSAQSLNYPASKLKIIGITGTAGKTTTTYLVEHILKSSGFKTALLGSIKNKILDKEENSELTTPESDTIHQFFERCVKKGVEYVVMEVSSHALSLHRTHGIKFDSVGFTNLSPEHLDFYKNMNNYFSAKSLIFDQIKTDGVIILNTDDLWGKQAFEQLQIKNSSVVSFGKKSFVSVTCEQLLGEFNSYNTTMAFLICKKLGVRIEKIKHAIKKFHGVPGRLQLHKLKNAARAFVDFAHKPASMQAVLATLRAMTNDLIVVFGCGGDRDKTKRPVMGKIATQFGDKVIITDDNPRFEQPEKIIAEILIGVDKKNAHKVYCEIDRKKAIERAVKISSANSIIALLGKGHEHYYLKNGVKIHFNDFEEVSKY